jgi:DNA-binding MarR family transcriptional regulator
MRRSLISRNHRGQVAPWPEASPGQHLTIVVVTTIFGSVKSGLLEKEIRQGRPLSLEEQVFLNLVRTADLLGRHEARVLRSRGLSGPQYNVLRILRGARPDGLRCSEVAARMVTRDPDVTRLFDRMERVGLISRSRGLEDRRVISARITPKGLAIIGGLDEPLRELLSRQLGHMSKSDLRRLNDLLERMREG